MQLTEEQKPMLRFLAVMTAASMLGLQGYTILFNNYAVEVVRLNGQAVGIIQSVREVPGFLALLAVFVMLVVKEHRLSAISIALLGIGTALTGIFPSYAGVACTTLVMSFGFHYYETTNQSLTLQYFSTGVTPLVMGRLRSLSALSSIGAGLLIWGLGYLTDFRGMFLVIGILVLGIGIWGMFQEPTHENVPPQRARMVLRRRYGLYYVLTFLSGARRQIFMVFSMFLLVEKFHFTVRGMIFLFVINNLIGYLMNPVIGRAIVRFGERAISSIEYLGVIVIFLTYAYSGSGTLVSFMYVLDSLLFNFAVAIRTYFQKVADPQDIAASMAVGFTINHIAAVFLPALGGYLWMISYQIPFLGGAALGAVSLAAAQFMRVPQNKTAPTELAEAAAN
ncbi:MFS transporter [Geomesophilobacter sediminis]|uniref:MFS transporter n=1 Tax=Geomesophilobacter sediminis TaxID=2798584 RepID=A0A8J7JKH7_9BACT|nr:MFS transporter [Geomesophilobacter sediminis]MBJ6723905.1 MFS transporter [Geomesophilobacter sediminis]